MKAIKTKFAAPYKLINGKLKPDSCLPFLDYKKKQSGVYFIKNEKTGEIVYIGYSEENLYKTIYRHFQEWNDKSRQKVERFIYPKIGYSVRIIFTTPKRAELLEKYLIVLSKPKDNSNKYENYLTKKESSTAASIIDDTITFKGKDEDFPF